MSKEECPICLEPPPPGQELMPWKSGCGHSFCAVCLVRHLQSRFDATCPLCRSEPLYVVEDEPVPLGMRPPRDDELYAYRNGNIWGGGIAPPAPALAYRRPVVPEARAYQHDRPDGLCEAFLTAVFNCITQPERQHQMGWCEYTVRSVVAIVFFACVVVFCLGVMAATQK